MGRARETARRIGGGLARGIRRRLARRALPRSGPFWVSLELPAGTSEAPVPAWSGRRTPSLLELLATIEAIAEERRVAGVLLRVAGSAGGLAAAESLRRALDEVRARGKRI